MKNFASIYFWYNGLLFKIVRILLFVLFFALTAGGVAAKIYPNLFLIPFSLFLIIEVFFEFKVAKLMPRVTVFENASGPYDSFSLESLGIFATQNNSGVIKQLLNLLQVEFIIGKIDANNKDIVILDIDKTEIANLAFSLSKELKGKYVTTMDLFVAYLLLTENKTKLLFNKKLKQEDIKNILLWARTSFTKEEDPRKKETFFAGEGFAESWVYGWTTETQKYMLDLSHEYLSEKEEPTGRTNEYRRILEALYKGGSVILVGDAGSGKEASVKRLAIDSFMGKLGGNLFHQKIFQLMVDAFMAGAQNQEDLEARLNTMIAEVSHSGNVIIYIPEFQNIMGSSSFHLDISGAITPYLQKKNLRIIAAVTPGAYKKFIEPQHTLLDNFDVIKFDEPDRLEVLDMLFKRSKTIEYKENIILTYKAVVSACDYADRYAKERVLPGSAVVLLEDTANAVKITGKKIIEEQDVLDQVEKLIKVSVGEPKPVEKELLLHLEDELHKRIVDQNEAVSSLAESIRRLRAGLTLSKKPISFLFLGPTGVGKTETAKALADIYFGHGARLIRLDMSEFSAEDGMKRLLGSSPGQGDEKGQLTEPVYDSPYSLILLDEFEKADKKILDLFLQVFDDGRLTDNKGKTVSFVNTIIIATSNAASEFVREEVGKGTIIDKKFQENLLEFLQSKGIFKPELLNRFDDIVVFKPLGTGEVGQIVKMMLGEFTQKLTEKDIKISFDDKVISKISNEGFDKNFGARPLKRFIQDNIEDMIAQKMLKDEIKRGDNLQLTTDPQDKILLNKI